MGRAKGFKHTKKSKEKMRLAKLGKSSGAKGIHRKFTEEHKRKISESHKGKKCYNWKGGIYPENKRIRCSLEYRLWRKSVLERDNYTCIWCYSKENLEVDHIKPFADYPELRFAIDNGRTLCKYCYRRTSTFGGKNNRK